MSSNQQALRDVYVPVGENHLPQDAPGHQCGGKMTCCECVVKVVVAPPNLTKTGKETSLLKFTSFSTKNHVLACAHDTEELQGGVFTVAKPSKN